MAAIRGDVKQVKELIGLGADVNVKDFAGKVVCTNKISSYGSYFVIFFILIFYFSFLK